MSGHNQEKNSEGAPRQTQGVYLRACQGAAVFLVTVLALVGLVSLVLP